MKFRSICKNLVLGLCVGILVGCSVKSNPVNVDSYSTFNHFTGKKIVLKDVLNSSSKLLLEQDYSDGEQVYGVLLYPYKLIFSDKEGTSPVETIVDKDAKYSVRILTADDWKKISLGTVIDSLEEQKVEEFTNNGIKQQLGISSDEVVYARKVGDFAIPVVFEKE